MKSTILELFDKKSPLFLIKIALLLITVLMKMQPQQISGIMQPQQIGGICTQKSTAETFLLVAIILLGLEIVVKIVFLELVQCFFKIGQNVKVLAFLVCYLGQIVILIFGAKILLSQGFRANCNTYQPFQAFLTFFVILLTIIDVGAVFYISDAVLSKKQITVLDRNLNQNQLYD